MGRWLRILLLPVVLLLNLWNISPHYGVHGANILAVLPSVWKSHYMFGRYILEKLVAQQNHTVTLISPHANRFDLFDANGVISSRKQASKIHEIHVDGLLENWLEMGLTFDVERLREISVMERFTRLVYAGTTNVDLLLTDKQVQQLLHSSERFDLLIVDLVLSDSLLGFSYYYNIPTVVLSPSGASNCLNHMLGNPQNSALDPSNFLPYLERMNIWQRSVNTLMGLFEKLTYNFFHMISQQVVYTKHFESLCQHAHCSLPHLRELTKNLSLVLINSHPIVQYPRAYLPNMIEIGGAHLRAETLKIPNHLKQFIETAKKGVVYMSLGADARTADLAREKLETILDVFGYLKDIRLIMKWELPNFDLHLPPNVLISDWFPQEALLAHPNVKVFISGCGFMSIFESIHSLTPILAIPIYPEQEVTAHRMQSKGVALIVPFDFITYDAILYGIEQLAFNVSYKRNMAQLCKLLSSTVDVAPLTKSINYIDLIVKTSGGDFLKSHANELNFVRSELIDVLAIIVLGVCGIIAVPFFVTCCILRKSYYRQANAANYRSALKLTVSTNSNPSDVLRRRRNSTSAISSSSSSSPSRSPLGVRGKREAFARHSQSSLQTD